MASSSPVNNLNNNNNNLSDPEEQRGDEVISELLLENNNNNNLDDPEEPRREEVTSELLSENDSSGEPPRDSTQKLGAWNGWKSITLDMWCLEIAAMVFSVACFIALAAVLIAYDGKQRPKFSYDISLNAIISILATACKSSLVFVVGAAISQLKWLWFSSQSRSLASMQIFEDASRGPLGSLALLGSHKGRSIASLGAIILVLMLAFEPFVQQILSYPTEPNKTSPTVNDTNVALAPQLQYFYPPIPDADWKAGYYSGLWSSNFGVEAHCPSGNCTWPIYRSVGVCSKCADVTSDAKLNCPTPKYNTTQEGMSPPDMISSGKCEVVLPKGSSSGTNVSITIEDGKIQLLGLESATVWEVYNEKGFMLGNFESFLDIASPLMVLAEAYLDFDSSGPGKNDTETDVLSAVGIKAVTECALSFCIQDYNVSVQNGATKIEKGPPDYGKFLTLDRQNYEGGRSSFKCWAPSGTSPDVELDFAGTTDGIMELNVSNNLFCTFRSFLSDYFIGTQLDQYVIPYDGSTAGSIPPPDNLARISDIGLNLTMSRTAAAFTQLGLQNTNITRQGTMYHTEVMVRVQWPWLALPALLIVSGNLFLALTMHAGRKEIPWKSSIPALLFHGVNHVERGDYTTASGMELVAENLRVQLQYSEPDGRTMLSSN